MSLTVTLDGTPITKQVSGLQIKSVSPGGFASVSFNLNRSLAKDLLEQFTDVLVYDGSTGEQVGGGRLMDQGRNDDGTWNVTCLGEGLASMQDSKAPYFLIDSTLEYWRRTSRTTKRMDASSGVYPNATTDEPALFMDTSDGVTISTNDEYVMSNQLAVWCNQQIGGIGFKHKSGRNDADWQIRGRLYSAAFSGSQTPISDNFSSTLSARRQATMNGDFSGVKPIAAFSWRYTGAGVTTTVSYWNAVKDPTIRAQIYDTTRTLRTVGYTNEYVMIDEGFTDMVARFCPRLDLANARIDDGTYQFDQLAWLDGITPMDAMTDLLNLESSFAWHVWEKTTAGLWATELVDTTNDGVRYEATVADGFSAPSPATDVFNKVYVRWTSPAGYTQTTIVTSTVQALDDAGVTRSDMIDLADEVGSTAQAAQRGALYLSEHAVAPNAGTLTIARPIQDNLTGRWVKPWNIRPGGLIRVRGVQPTPDTLNATSPDGVTVFRVVSSTYDNDSGVATLELDQYELTEARAIANLSRARPRKR